MDSSTAMPIEPNGINELEPRTANGFIKGEDVKATVIARDGDLVLRVQHQTKAAPAVSSFRVSSLALKSHSKYFARLLQPGRFGEGAEVEERQRLLRKQYNSLDVAPSAELPTVDIKDLGRISKINSAQNLFADFMYIVHSKDTQTFPPVANLANLAIVADRFDALGVVARYVQKKKILQAIDGKTTLKQENNLPEEKVRQKLLVAVMLDYPPWVLKYSSKLITHGWMGKEIDNEAALWWDLPSRIEEELLYRRHSILDTIQSLQSYFLGLYTGRQRQCKLGYDSSAQCDSYQLGEMIRFFSRIGTLGLRGVLADHCEVSVPYSGNIYNILETLRGVPEYQIDRNHTHCGIRTRLVPLLDVVEECLISAASICLECWQDDCQGYAWIHAKRPLVWRKFDMNASRLQGHPQRHADVRTMATAIERDWGGTNIER